VESAVVAADGASAGPVTGGTVVTVHGVALDAVASVTFGGTAGQVVAATADTVTITTPPAPDLAMGPVTVELFDAAGVVIPSQEAAAGLADATATDATSTNAAPTDAATTEAGTAAEAAAAAETSAKTAPANSTAATAAASKATSKTAKAASASTSTAHVPLTFNYVPDPRITAQVDYALTYWSDYNTAAYGRIPGNDCVNFTSQSLIARGWAMDSEWNFNSSTGQYSPAWASSTALAAYLAAHPERAVAVPDTQRGLVKAGDIVQFDWDHSGDRDHTGIVTRVEKSAAGVKVFFAGHTMNTSDKSVDETLANTGGTVSYWSVK
jgi:hypothetical protein